MTLLATTNYAAIVRPLQWLVIALIFLFFLRVIRAVWVETRPAGQRVGRAERRTESVAQQDGSLAAKRGRRRKELRLEVLEPLEYEGRTFDIDGEVTLGRSPGCGVPTTYDVYSSTLHARVFHRNNQLWVEDLGSTNGTFVNSERISKPTKLAKGDVVQVGATVFEVAR